MYIPKKGFTHAGTFHADEVFCTAFFKILNPNFIVERGYVVPENYDGIVYDIGLGKYDHHQADNEVRKNGIPYASFGKVFRDFGTVLFTRHQCNLFDGNFIQGLDNADNTSIKDTLCTIVGNMNPAWDDERTEKECFEEAVKFAMQILTIQFNKIKEKDRACKIVEQKIREMNDNILILDVYMPFQEPAVKNKVDFVVYPSKRGGYNIQTVPKSFQSHEPRVSFPEEWLGQSPSVLDTFVKGMFFCHKGNFLASADTLEHVIEVAKKAKQSFK